MLTLPDMTRIILFSVLLLLSSCAQIPKEGKHLFILSGQSNMWALDIKMNFVPAIEKKFGNENVIIVKDAQGNEPIYKWYKKWRLPTGEIPEHSGELYDRLMGNVNLAISGQPIKTITFIWMQGETDAKLEYGDKYADSLIGLYRQLQKDMKRKDINFVIGQLSDFDLINNVFRDWTKVRNAQIEVAKKSSRFILVNTDDLNDGIRQPKRRRDNDLHYSPQGFNILGERFAKSAAELIEEHAD